MVNLFVELKFFYPFRKFITTNKRIQTMYRSLIADKIGSSGFVFFGLFFFFSFFRFYLGFSSSHHPSCFRECVCFILNFCFYLHPHLSYIISHFSLFMFLVSGRMHVLLKTISSNIHSHRYSN